MYVKAIIILCGVGIVLLIVLFSRGSSNGSGSSRDNTGDRKLKQDIRTERENIGNNRNKLRQGVGVIRENIKTQRRSNNRIREIIEKAKNRSNTDKDI
jgi:hypothetical protein